MAKSLKAHPRPRSEARVAVLMAVKDGIEWLPAAVQSILTQTFSQFRFIIIDDGSDDETARYLKTLRDRRIQLVRNPKSLGLTKSLNKGLRLVREEYIARMDADDVAVPERLQIQVDFMDTHPNVGICGSARYIIGDQTNKIYNTVQDSEEIAVRLLFENPLAHPTTIIRRNLLEKFQLSYNEHLRFAQDYDLWSRAAEFTQIKNIPQPLLYYRHHQKQISATRLAEQTAIANSIRKRNLGRLGLEPSPRQQKYHNMLSGSESASSSADIFACLDWINVIHKQNEQNKVFNPVSLSRVLTEKASIMIRAYWQHTTRTQKLARFLKLIFSSIISGHARQLIAILRGFRL
jgi:glycosyltransferase involved in cell wall biosynthesis